MDVDDKIVFLLYSTYIFGFTNVRQSDINHIDYYLAVYRYADYPVWS